MQKALQALPWVRKAEIDYDKKLARVTVERKSFKPQALIDALKGAGFGGKLIEVSDQDKAAKTDPLVTFHVIGMKKTKSGAI